MSAQCMCIADAEIVQSKFNCFLFIKVALEFGSHRQLRMGQDQHFGVWILTMGVEVHLYAFEQMTSKL